MSSNTILCDTRWIGPYGIGRFADEVIQRLPNARSMPKGFAPYPFHPLELIWLNGMLQTMRPQVYFSPGYNPPVGSPVPFVFTIHDLIVLHFPEAYSLKMQLYFNTIVRRATHQASRILTISEYSRRSLLCWTGLPEDRIVNVSCGVSPVFQPQGAAHTPGYPYLFYIGSHRPQKNLYRLLQAFARSSVSQEVCLLLSGSSNGKMAECIQKLGLVDRVKFAGTIADAELPAYYRGAIARTGRCL
jgi:glycosyltransferase involved in cell wall biosynthesis